MSIYYNFGPIGRAWNFHLDNRMGNNSMRIQFLLNEMSRNIMSAGSYQMTKDQMINEAYHTIIKLQKELENVT